MADYTDLPNTAVGVGGIPSGTTVTALRDNPIAIAERATGAPKPIDDYELLSRTVISGSPAAVDFTFDPTLYDAIVFKLGNVSCSSASALFARSSSDGGATFDGGASDYRYANVGAEDDGTALLNTASTGADAIYLGSLSTLSDTHGYSGTFEVSAPNISGRRTRMSHQGAFASGSRFVAISGSSERRSNGIVNAVRFFMGSGSLASGTITMYGVRNS